jgi:hypothetical protein
MLRGLHNETYEHPEAANRINRVITVNTPHFGSSLAAANTNDIIEKYPGLTLIINDIDYPKDHLLVEADVDISFWDNRMVGLISPDWYWFLLGFKPYIVSSIMGADDVKLTIKGPYLGPYKAKVTAENFFGKSTVYDKTIDYSTLKKARSYMEETRNNGKQNLDPYGNFITNLNYANARLFPTRPNRTKVTLLPMYSDSSHKILPEIFEMLGEEANKLCAKGDETAGCLAAATVFESYAEKLSGKSIFNTNISDNLWNALLDIQDGWLKQSDAIVEVESQKFTDKSKNLFPEHPELEGHFLKPRNYVYHDAINHSEAVLHGPKINKGAPQQGMDLACALTPACDEKLQIAGVNFLRLIASNPPGGIEASAMSIDLQGDFDVYITHLSKNSQGIALSIGDSLVLHAEYSPGKGSFINGNKILDERIVTQPSIARKGNDIIVSFNHYSGKSFKETIAVPNLPSSVRLSVLASLGEAMSSLAVGTGSASNPETQKPPSPPPGNVLAPVTLAAIHREARGEHESNTSRPRFLVYNATEDTLAFSKAAYYFTADPARMPKVVVDYPSVPVTVENLGGDQWRFVLDVGNQKIAPKQFYPSTDGWQIRVHYSDWYEYEHLDDWSADYSIGLPKLNRKIVIYDKNGKIIWGKEPADFESKDNSIISMPKGTIAWKDDAPWETNAFKPRVTVKNTGSVALSNYHAQLWFRVPQGKNLSPLDIWYAPESSPSVKSVKNAGGRVWMLDMHFDEHILYSGDSVSEGNIGLHLADWSNFDKTVCGIVLKDKDGNVLFGKEPSVAECESYDGPDLLMPQYSRR